jgi:tetrahydromethanopterin S-methyltransferase subunit F
MGIVFVMSVGIANRLPTTYDSGRRYLLLSLPLLPLVLFRVEPWLMVWVVASLSFAFRSEWQKSSLAAVVASLTKGWPILLFALPFRAGQRRIALSAGVLTALLLFGIALLPGFREGRAFDGIHSETIVGSMLLAYRGAIGASPQLVGAAGAAYVGAGSWAAVLNIMIGLPFVLIGIRALSRSSEVRTQTIATGLVVAGVILGSPLLSAQFVFWLVPFVLFLKLGHRTLYFAASAVTLATMIWWEPAELAWSALVVGRNGLLLALAIAWALSLRTDVRETSALDHIA